MNHAVTDMQALYREVILDHSRSPRHFGRMENATHVADGINPLSGDKLRLYLQVDEQGTISASSFEGSGCAVSVASASLLTDTISGVEAGMARRWFREITSRLNDPCENGSTSSGLEKFAVLDGVRSFPSRIKCATLAWHALDAALNNKATPASTE